MSKITFAPNVSGTGTLTVAAPNTNSDYTLTLPAETGTVLTSGGAIDVNASAPADSLAIGASGNVGIGTSSPASKLEVRTTDGEMARFRTTSGSNQPVLNITASDSAGTVGFGTGGNASFPALTFSNGGSERMRINSSGQTILGSDTSTVASNVLNIWSPTSTLNGIYMQKSGQCEVQIGFKSSTDTNFYIGTGSPTMGTYGVYLSNTGNSWNAVSDERKKNIIEPIENGLEKVNSLRAVIGSYKHDPQSIRRPFLIAQDVQAVLPEAVNVQDEEDGTLGMSYTDTIPLLVAAIKELKVELDAAKERIASLEGAGNVPT